jgi:hypothetical protein
MNEQAEVITLLREIRDIQSERLQLQKQAIKDNAEIMEKQRQGLSIARSSSLFQKLALSVLVLAGIVVVTSRFFQ